MRPTAATNAPSTARRWWQETGAGLAGEIWSLTFPDGVQRWVFAASTLAAVHGLCATSDRPVWQSRLPAWMNEPYLRDAAWQWGALAVLVPLSYLFPRAFSALCWVRSGSLAAESTMLRGTRKAEPRGRAFSARGRSAKPLEIRSHGAFA